MAVSASVVTGEGAQFPEEARTGASLYVQQYLHTGSRGDYERLTAAQAGSADMLQPYKYRELHELSHDAMPDAETYEAVQFINLVHDIGKNPELMRAVGLDPEHDSHDEGLRRLFRPEYRAALEHFLPSYADPSMFTDHQRYLIEGTLTADFNFARFTQSQVSQRELEQLALIPRDILKLIIIHGIHDIGGVMGHKNLTSSLTLDTPNATRLLDAAYALLGSAYDLGLEPETEVTPALRHYGYLKLRAARFGLLPQENPTDADMVEFATLIGVANLLKCNNPEEFAVVEQAYDSLSLPLRGVWSINQGAPLTMFGENPNLQKMGTEYLPAFLRAALKRGDVETTTEALGYFSQALQQVIALETMINLNDERGPDYDQINFYHLAQYMSKKKPDGIEPIYVIYKSEGQTVTPIPVDASYRGEERVFKLRHYSKYNVKI
jgi:hypothetical protein